MAVKLDEFWNLNFKYETRYEEQNLVDLRYRYIKKFIGKKSRILDFGFGTGYFLIKLSKLGFETYGFDLPRKNLKQVSRKFNRKNIKVDFGKIKNIPYKDNFFDYVISSEVFEHLTKKEMLLAFRKIYRILKNGGKLVISVPWKENLKENYLICPYCLKKFHPYLHKQSFNENKLTKIGYQIGFKKMKIIKFLTFVDFFYKLPFELRFLVSQLFIELRILKPFYLLAVFKK